MIRLTENIPACDSADPCLIKIGCNAELYRDIALFWEQDGGKAFISMLDGNMVIYNINADIEELKEFLAVISPSSVFSDLETVCALDLELTESVDMLTRASDVEALDEGDELSSGQLYDILDTNGLSLPPYEFFAVDICRRLNHGKAQYFGKNGICAAVSVNCGDYALINGIASRKKGMGSVALCGILSKNRGRTAVVCCKKEVTGFYLKNGFELQKNYAYWVRK